MILPQFSLRMALGLMAVLAFVSLVVSRGLQGSSWAMGVTITLAALVFAFLAYAAVFGIVFVISRAFHQRPTAPRIIPARATAGEPVLPAQPRDNTDLMPPPTSDSL
jgi:hypothetical protein